MVHNPSHLELQNAVTIGKTRAKQEDYGYSRSVLNLQGHGDSAFIGQGAAYESMGLCKLPNYSVGGTIHFITNNNVGFTTTGRDSWSSWYASGICNAFEVPVLHVNSFDLDSLLRTCKFAVKYWQTYRKDIMLDMIGFWKYGHNEVDEPGFT